MNVADEMEWYCCGLILLHYLQDWLIMIGKSAQINSVGGGNRRLAVFSRREGRWDSYCCGLRYDELIQIMKLSVSTSVIWNC